MHTWTLRRGGVLLTVDEYGPADAPAALVLHGVGSSADFAARAFGPALGGDGYRVIVPDLRGHGRSTALADPAAHAVGEQLADVAALAALVGARVLAGVSLGAHLALAHAAAECAAAPAAVDLVLAALPGWLGPADEVASANAVWAEEIARVGVAASLARIAGDPAVPEWVARELATAWPRHDPASLAAALRAAATAEAPDAAALTCVACPVGVVGAGDDAAHPLAAATAYVAVLPRAALVTVPLAVLAGGAGRLGELALAAAGSVSAPR